MITLIKNRRIVAPVVQQLSLALDAKPNQRAREKPVDVVLAAIVVALNKVDLLDAEQRARLAQHYPDALPISAASGDGIDMLIAAIATECNNYLLASVFS